jgi:hypothetical protein
MEIIIREGTYYSEGDEASFFNRLQSLKCVSGIKGAPDGLHVRFAGPPSNAQLRELIATLYRYGLDMRPLAAFRTKANEAWFCDPKMFWYEHVFGARAKKAAHA